MLFELGTAEVLGEGFVRRGLAGEDEIAAAGLDGGGDGLTGEEVVAEIDRPIAQEGRAMLGEPALGGAALAVLLLRAVLRDDELGRQRQDLRVAGCHEACAEKGMEALDATVGSAPRGALRAADLARGEVLRPIH